MFSGSEPLHLGFCTGGAAANPVQNIPRTHGQMLGQFFLNLCVEYMLNFKCRRTEGPNNKLLHVLQWCIAVWAAISVMQTTDISFLLFIISQVLIQVSKPFE